MSATLTTVIPFAPSPLAPFQFSAVLDGTTYNVTVTWNVYRAGGFGWYINVYQENGVVVFSRALIASPPGYNISMTAGYFTTSIVFLDQTQQFVIGG